MKRKVLWIFLPLTALATLLVTSCADIGYYSQCVTGHLAVMAKRKPIVQLLEDPRTPPELKEQLTKVLQIRDFASSQLGLPRNGSYSSYADLQRPFVVWNVVATPEFSLTPRQWCFPVAGCVSYRGYFDEDRAKGYADELRNEGADVYSYGVAAYSTLSWFEDPVLNTFCSRPTPYLAGLIFHELAHQALYIPQDSAFNEAFAKTVELEGVQRWLAFENNEEEGKAYLENFQRDEQIIELIRETRQRLGELYAQGADIETKRREKTEILAGLTTQYQKLKEQWGGYAGFDRWFDSGLNNAKLASVSTYRKLVPAFQELLRREGGDLPSFFQAAAALGKLPEKERIARLAELSDAGGKRTAIETSHETPGSS